MTVALIVVFVLIALLAVSFGDVGEPPKDKS